MHYCVNQPAERPTPVSERLAWKPQTPRDHHKQFLGTCASQEESTTLIDANICKLH